MSDNPPLNPFQPNEWMPRAGKHCVLPAGHKGPHRSRR